MFKTDVYLRVSNTYRYELIIEAAFKEYANFHNLDDEQIEDIQLAIREACINIIKHSQCIDKKMHIGFDYKNGKMKVIIKDKGKGFDISKIKKPDIEKMVREHKKYKGGWGIMLLDKYMDKVNIRSVPNKGTTITMYKYIDKK